jgi:hypothetical protein
MSALQVYRVLFDGALRRRSIHGRGSTPGICSGASVSFVVNNPFSAGSVVDQHVVAVLFDVGAVGEAGGLA